MKLAVYAAGGACILLMSGCSKTSVDPNVLAKVGEEAITVRDFEREVAWRRQCNRPIPAKETLLEEMITQRTLVQQARAAGLEQDMEVRETLHNVLVDKLKVQKLQPKQKAVEVTAEEVRQRYQQNLAHYTTPPQMRLATLYLKLDSLMEPERVAALTNQMLAAQQKATQLPPALMGFGALAIDNSEDQSSRYKGGDIGWFNEGEPSRWPEEIMKAGFSLKNNGDVSDVIRTSHGLYVVRRVDARPGRVTPLEQVQDSIRRRLATEKRQQLEQNFIAEIRHAQPVTVNQQALGSITVVTTQLVKKSDVAPPAMP
ncbi:MAG: peptidyl-prolyl cis-trans isomerase [Verrucomicrobiota bacterium]